MIGRRQLAVASPVSASALIGAAVGAARPSATRLERARDLVRARVRAGAVALTDSGTSALVLALRAAVPPNGVVGFPGYACVDLAAAALFAGVRVRVYDLDPDTLGPDLDAVAAMLRRGVDAIVVAHLFGYPADVPAVRALASAAGVATIEDAAQGAGAQLGGVPLGALGDLGVMSFGRGKGLCACGGGALVGFGDRWTRAVSEVALPSPGAGWSGLFATGVQWALGRPAVYAIPSAVPWLHLGEMVYHPAHEPESLSSASASVLASALELETADLAGRRAAARVLDRAASSVETIGRVRLMQGADAGYLRYAVRDLTGARVPDSSLGIVRPYPVTVPEQAELAPILMPGESPVPGASELRQHLFTLPTHRFVNASDLRAISAWIGRASGDAAHTPNRVADHDLDVTRGNLPR